MHSLQKKGTKARLQVQIHFESSSQPELETLMCSTSALSAFSLLLLLSG